MVKALCCVRTKYQFKEKMREQDMVTGPDGIEGKVGTSIR
jgi:hypothetical protein